MAYWPSPTGSTTPCSIESETKASARCRPLVRPPAHASAAADALTTAAPPLAAHSACIAKTD
eukprot:14813333-Alexandrium_andersonii.AAC.1